MIFVLIVQMKKPKRAINITGGSGDHTYKHN